MSGCAADSAGAAGHDCDFVFQSVHFPMPSLSTHVQLPNQYHNLLVIRDGLIVEGREYMDTKATAEAFG
jgi:ketosteroid isomerase-like protein